MASLKIEGGRALSGRVAVEGNKNSALPLIAACMLTEQVCEIRNVPRIRDVDVLLELIEQLGATVEGKGSGTLRIQCATVSGDRPDPVLVGRLRGSVLLLAPLLARVGSARLAPPGGDFPARRTISTHLEALTAMGAIPLNEPGHAMRAPDGLKGVSLYLDEASVTGTETALIAAPLKKMGLDCSYDDDRLIVRPSALRGVRRITTGLWPGFPSDLVSLVTVLATQADGRTLVHDWLYELRLFALEQMSAMRADLFLCDPHRIIVNGPTKLRGRVLDSRDLRSGMALIAAALAAEGESQLSPLETVERGYGQLVDRLRALGAQVEKKT